VAFTGPLSDGVSRQCTTEVKPSTGALVQRKRSGGRETPLVHAQIGCRLGFAREGNTLDEALDHLDSEKAALQLLRRCDGAR